MLSQTHWAFLISFIEASSTLPSMVWPTDDMALFLLFPVLGICQDFQLFSKMLIHFSSSFLWNLLYNILMILRSQRIKLNFPRNMIDTHSLNEPLFPHTLPSSSLHIPSSNYKDLSFTLATGNQILKGNFME